MTDLQAIDAWMEKRDKLEQLANACDVLKLSPDGFRGVIPGLRKFAAGTNMNLSSSAIRALAMIAKGTRQAFRAEGKALVPVLTQKYKERKPALVQNVKDFFAALKNSFTEGLLDVIEEVIEILGDKNPTIKVNTLKWASELALQTYIDDFKEIGPQFVPIFKKLTNDSAPDVRDATLSFLGIFKARLGEQPLNAVLSDLNPSKMSKVDESAGEVKKSPKYDRPRKQEPPPPPPKVKKTRKPSAMQDAAAPVGSTTEPPAASEELMTFDMGGGGGGFGEPPKRLGKKKKPPAEKKEP